MKKIKVIIMGAAGRDFFDYNVYFRNNPHYEVVAFTAAQIPGIEEKDYPKELAGKLYPKGIRIHKESELPWLIKRYKIDYVYLAYSDLSNQSVMEKASIAIANGANFGLLGAKDTMLKSKKPVISVCAVRTGAGKSQTSRAIGQILKKHGKKVVAIRHPMPYGNLIKQEVQRFSNKKDFVKNKCTVEEMEEYRPWVNLGFTVYAGVDYEKIIKRAEKEAEVILFDGGNNDWSFYKPDLNIVVADSHRPSHEILYYPGFVNFLMAEVIIINKINTAPKSNVKVIEDHVKKYNPKAIIIKAKSVIHVDKSKLLKNKRVLVIGDGPSLTHGGLLHSAAYYIVKKYGAKIVDAKKHAVGSIREVYKRYPHLKLELPAMGYSKKQLKELQDTINRADCEVVLDSSPANLGEILKVNKPIVNVGYELDNESIKKLENILKKKKFI